MKINKTLTALIAGASIGMSGQAFSAGTTAGITVTNSTSLSYDVSGVNQTPIGVDTSFMVDHKVDMTLADNSGTIEFIPGETVTYTYALLNTGNKTQYYNLDITNSSTTDTADVSIASAVYALEAGYSGTATYSGGILTVPVDETADFTVTFDFPRSHDNSALNDGRIVNANSFYVLASAEAVQSDGSAISDDLTTDKNANSTNLEDSELIVYAEIASTDSILRDGTITVETLSTAKTADFTDNNGGAGPGLTITVINDILCDTSLTSTSSSDYSDGASTNCPNAVATYVPKALPGAMVKYTIIAKNEGAVTATDVKFFQDLTTENISEVVTADLLPGTLDNVTITFTEDTTDVENAGRSASDTTTASLYDDTNELEVTVDFFEVGDLIEISFTALVKNN